MDAVVHEAIDVSLNYGKSLLNNNDRHKALSVFTECLNISQNTGHVTSIAASLGCLGMFYMTSNDITRGVSCYERALEFLNNVDENDAERKAGNSKMKKKRQQIKADAYSSIGSAMRKVRNFPKSVECFQKYLQICEELADTRGKTMAFGNMGALHRNLGHIKQAMECFEKELQIAEVTGDKSLEFHAHTNLGLCYRDVGEYQKALRCYEKSLAVVMVTRCRKDEGGAYSNLSNIYRYLGDPVKALSYSKKHLELATQLGDLKGQFIASGGLGNAYCALGDFKSGSTFFQENANLARKIGDKALIARAEHSLGLALWYRKEYRESLTHHETAHSLFKEAGMTLPAYHAMLAKAKCLRTLQEYKAAMAIYQTCITEYEGIRAHLGKQENLKISIGDLHIIVYKALSYTMFHTGQVQDAMLVEDRGRAMALKDLLYHKFEVKTVYKRMTEHPKDVNSVSKFLDEMREDPDVTTVMYSFFNGQMFIWVVSHSRVDCIRPWSEKEGEKYWALMELVETSLNDIRQGVREHELVEDRLLLASETDNCADIFAIQESLSLPWNLSEKGTTDPKALSTEKRMNRKMVSKPSTTPAEVSHPGSTLRQLYDILIKPVVHLIQGNKLLVIPEAALYRLPFSALLDGEGIFLSRKFSIQVCTSLETLALISKRPKREFDGGALVIGNPLVGRVHRMGREVKPSELPGAQKEAERVASLLYTTALTQQMATKSRVINYLVKASIVHIAAHGDPVKGEIVLAPETHPNRVNQLPKEEDYLLTCADIASLNLRARLVVLSCCQTAHGDIRAEGVVGIARSFLGAGASAVVVTLWAIDDDATLAFMELFYKHVTTNMPICQALQYSMMTLQGKEHLKRISNWAPFYAIGEDVKFTCSEIQQMKEKAFNFSA